MLARHCSSSRGKCTVSIEDANIYIDDVGAFSSDWDHHVNLLVIILWQLQGNGFTINPLNCEWAVKELTG